MTASSLKRWPGWALLLLAVTALLAVGVTRDDGPRAPAERAADLAERVACPNCMGETVSESRTGASENIRQAIRQLVDEGRASDEEILQYLETTFGSQTLLVPQATGFDALVWALPAAAAVIGVAALAATFRRWRREQAGERDPTPAERALVAAALADDAGGDGDEP